MEEDFSKRLYVENVMQWNEYLTRKRFSDEVPEVKFIAHGIILPLHRDDNGKRSGGVCDSDFNFVAGYQRNKKIGNGGFNCVEESYTVDKKELLQIDEDVIYGGLVAEHFGHFMMECWCRLWYILQHPELKSKIIFLTIRGYNKWFDEFFKLMGIEKERIVYIKKPTQFRSVTVPQQAQYDWTHVTKEWFVPYMTLRERIKPRENTPKKLYLTRLEFEAERARNMACLNEKYFEDFFVEHGFVAVAMEKLPIEEQISLIMGADEIVGTLGTLTHWAIYCKPRTKFIMINRSSDFILNIQCWINLNFDVDWYIVDGSKNILFGDRTHGVCLLGSNKYWKEFVADYFGERLDEDKADSYLDEVFDKYLELWCKKYVDSKEILIDSLKNMCYRYITLEREIERNRPALNYQTHIGYKGWSAWKIENQSSNDIKQKYNLQAIRINFSKPFHDIYYSVYFNDKEGWSSEVSTGQMAGTTGQDKSVRGIKIRLDDSGAEQFDIFYRVHKFDDEWTHWAKNGEELISHGVKLNAIQIKLKAKENFD